MTLRQELRTCTAQLAASKTALDKAQADLASCEMGSVQKDEQIVALTTQRDKLALQVTTLQAEVDDLHRQLEEAQKPPPPSDPFRAVPLGGDLAAIVKGAGVGAKLQLPAKLMLKGSVTPLTGQHLRGPCEITPAPGTNIGFAINCKTNEAQGVTLENLDVSGFGLRGLQPWAGNMIKGGRYHHNGEMGIGVDMNGRDLPVVTLDSVETDYNGTGEFLGHGASGVKFFHVRRSRVIDCYTHDNTGNGWWWDAECGEIEVHGGRCAKNLRKGIFLEKIGGAHASSGAVYDGFATVDGVSITGNNVEKSAQGNAGIYFVASKNAKFSNCTFGTNINAIVVRNDPDRLTGQHADHPGWVVSGVEIQDSTNTYNADKVIVGSDVQGVKRT